MNVMQAFTYALKMVLHSKLRSWLTIIGIVIGVAAVIAIISIGEGLQRSITSELSSLGADLITISPGAERGFRGFGNSNQQTATDEEVVLDRADVQALKGISDVSLIDTNIRGSVDVYYLGKQGSSFLNGVDQDTWAQMTTLDISEGRFLGPSDTNVIMIGGRLANGFFDSPIGVNQMLKIEESTFRVVGIIDDESTQVIMPINFAYNVLDDKTKDQYDSITVKIKDEERLDDIIAHIDEKLKLTRHVTDLDKDFSISSSKQQQERRAEILSSLTVFLAAIAAVALLVGAVGIANTMFTSVLEKTKEIGIMKAIGAKNRDILLIFVLNAGLIGLIGGLIGVLFGYLLSGMLPALMGSEGITGRLVSRGTIVTLESVFLALSISTVIGIIAGLVPAYQASRLKPVDALRYE